MGQTISHYTGRLAYGTIEDEQTTNGEQRQSRQVNASTEGIQQESQYEELMQNAVTCPTCKGLGRVSRDQENGIFYSFRM